MEKRLLVKSAKNGDKEALLNLIMERKNEFYKLAYVYTENKEDAMDAMENMIVILYQQIRELKNDEAFYSWSKTILINCCRAILRKGNKEVLMYEIIETFHEESYEAGEKKVDILKYLKILNEYQQEAIKLKYFEDMDYKSIAKVSNVAVGTVKSRISTGLKRLKESFGGEY
ncbi:RNA polymerase sigma factor [Clostridium estertheticum]|uniref:RNA polymerase sigma factor n=1 Tax=Clostridium estertheticum TaxID=238834 RepID=UPI001CF3E9AE|nr:RNA polymerase sigma factor [Clostridium estertheticum]MCB2308575.1 RNA polymerase sigma factor [Clostridium estertheticum]MCB2344658.1 RNA polymerase sigma factor [Clostridium estertheticum]MCB2351561.1 RNA polymerase sigma factor [Clostridium estertheticum]WAG45527.1 RNA polymerase sigma factor [Clostridium estertheticum]